jgi:3-oxoacyl-[acyl-carrier protein] reductase
VTTREASRLDLAGRVAFVTGSSRGIGRSIALALARAGADVALHANTRRTAAEDVAGEIEAMGRRAFVCLGDISTPALPAAWMEDVGRKFGRLDVLVNNAAFVAPNRMPEADPQVWHRIIDVNLKGPYNCIKAALPLLSAAGGTIVNIGALNSRAVSPAGSAYAAAKAGLVAMTRNAAPELAPLGIRINAVAPPLTDTEMGAQAQALSGQAAPGLRAGQRIASPDEVAAVVLLFCTSLTAYISGETLYMGGGYTARPA